MPFNYLVTAQSYFASYRLWVGNTSKAGTYNYRYSEI